MRAIWAVLLGLVASMTLVTPATAAVPTGGDSHTFEFLSTVRDLLPIGAPLAVLRARDAGHDIEQVVDAAGEGQLGVDGTVTDGSGVVAPDGPPTDVLATAGEAEVEQAISDTQDRLADTKGVNPSARDLEDDLFAFAVLLGLMAEGYTLEQIVLDGLLADGIRFPGSWLPPEIVDEDGQRIQPGDEPVDPVIASLIGDTVKIVQGLDPLNPKFKPRYQVTYRGEIVMDSEEEIVATVTAKGRLGTVPKSGECCLGKLTGKMVTPPEDCTGGETIPITIAINGFEEDGSGRVALAQGWGVSGPIQSSFDPSSSDDFCLGAEDLAEGSLPFFGSILGPLRGFVEEGESLESFSDELGEGRLRIQKKI